MSFSRITNSTGTVQYYSSQTKAGSSTPSVSTTLGGVPSSPTPNQIIPASASYEETLEQIQHTHTHMMSFFGAWQKGGNDVAETAGDGDAPEAVVDDEDDFDGLEIDLPGGNPNEGDRKKGDKVTRK